MPTLLVKTPLVDKGLEIAWKNGRVVPKLDEREEKSEWSYLQSKGLYGKYGHSLSLGDCLFTDLAIAITVAAGYENVTVSADGKEQIRLEKEREDSNPIPSGATS